MKLGVQALFCMLNIFAVGTHNVHQDSQEDMEFDPRDPFLSDLKFSNDFDKKWQTYG